MNSDQENAALDDGEGRPLGEAQWSEHARASLRKAAANLVAGLQTYAATVQAMTGRQREVPELFHANDELAHLAHAFNDALFELTGTGISWAAEFDDDDLSDDDESPSTIAHQGIVAVLRREDFLVTDADLVINAGRSAFLQSWPDDQPDDSRFRVDNLGTALYELVHAHGEDNLSHTFEQTGGLAPGRSTILFTLAEGQLDPDADDPFKDVDGSELRTIYRFTNL